MVVWEGRNREIPPYPDFAFLMVRVRFSGGVRAGFSDINFQTYNPESRNKISSPAVFASFLLLAV